MALFRIEQEGQGLVPFAQYAAGDGLYEREVEDLLWDNLEEVLGRTLFRVARQAHLPHVGIPDILALDETGRIVVIEVKRDVDRQLLSQSLEYAGWARESNLQGETLTWSTGRHTIQVPPSPQPDSFPGGSAWMPRRSTPKICFRAGFSSRSPRSSARTSGMRRSSGLRCGRTSSV